jgi:hypothetical protein
MLQQVYNSAQLASLPADKAIDLSDKREAFFHLINLSPHCFEIWNEKGVIIDVCREWNEAWVAIGKAAEVDGITIHGLATLGVAPDAGAQKVLYELTTQPSGPVASSAPAFVEINGANKSAILTNVSCLAASATRLDSGLASRKSIRVTNDTGNANAVALGYNNAVTVAVPPAAATDGILLRPGNAITFGLGPGLQLWGKANVANVLLGVEELA